MASFAAHFLIDDTSLILDIGGTAYNWQFLSSRPRVVLLNCDESLARLNYPSNLTFQVGDARMLTYPDNAFDLVFSNSVIEHVGAWEDQVRFAREACRVGRSLWIQTPAREFFVEPHLLTPFFHWLPVWLQRRTIRYLSVWGWIARPTVEQAERFLLETRLLSKAEFASLFPDCTIMEEKFLGMTKSYIAIRS